MEGKEERKGEKFSSVVAALGFTTILGLLAVSVLGAAILMAGSFLMGRSTQPTDYR